MKTHPDDDALRQWLRRSWTVEPRRAPEFRAAVWARIAAARHTPTSWSGWLRLNVARVAFCAVGGVVCASAGGGLLAAAQAGREREQLIRRYVVSIDPHQQMSAAPQP